MGHEGIYRHYVKRLLDIILSMFAIVLLSPVILITGLLVRIKLGRPVVFKQSRPGLNEKIFCLYKYRSMTNETGEDGRLLPDSRRLTRFGMLLRSTSLDELPELFNIIKGDMSIVGPRPLSVYYLPHYPSDLRRRHDVRPGLTGLAQVNGRDSLQWDERFALDIEYVDNVSFVLDVKIIINTILKVLKRSDISVRGTTKLKDYGPYRVLQEENNGGKRLDNTTYSEIGSYYWLEGNEKPLSEANIEWLPAVNDSCFTFSGRSAIDTALEDILNNCRINRVYIPSYCCVAMLQPFLDRGLKIKFYEVTYKDRTFTYEIPDADVCTIVLIMSYFGLDTAAAHKACENLHKKGAVIIEDITHSLLCDNPVSKDSDYMIASLRKWFPIPAGGWVGKRNAVLRKKPDLESNHAVKEKIGGMREKYEYLTGKLDSKENFLLAQAKFENDLIHADQMLKIDDTSLGIIADTDIKAVTDRRRKNAEIICSGLSDLAGIVLSLPKLDLTKDTPLFLPIFMKTEDRDELKQYLMERGIYCPVHWPEVMGADAGIRANELSLICDQRYSEKDMYAIIDTVHEWYQNRI